jgi:hypothetical protein
MKKVLLGLIALPFLVAPVIAQNTDSANTSVRPTASPTASVSPQPLRKLNLFQNRVESRDENRLEVKQQNLELKREQFQERLRIVKDEKKKQILEHINDQLSLINQRATDAMLNQLARLQALLLKIKERAPSVDITAAQAKIDEAKTAVDTQAAKEYIIEFSDESGLKVGASDAKTQLRADLKAVKEKVRLAREAVVAVLKVAKTTTPTTP